MLRSLSDYRIEEDAFRIPVVGTIPMPLTRNATVLNLTQLVDRVGAGCLPDDPGPNVAMITLWDGRTVTGNYYNGDRHPDIIEKHADIIIDSEALDTLLSDLLDGGRADVITSTGSHDMVCTLRWTLTGTGALAA